MPSPPHLAHFILGSRFLGTATWPDEFSHNERHEPYSRAFFCMTCGEVWARIVVNEGNAWAAVHHRACPRHRGRVWLDFEGLLWFPHMAGPMPVEALVEELKFALEKLTLIPDSGLA
jgi:hypothetical protein